MQTFKGSRYKRLHGVLRGLGHLGLPLQPEVASSLAAAIADSVAVKRAGRKHTLGRTVVYLGRLNVPFTTRQAEALLAGLAREAPFLSPGLATSVLGAIGWHGLYSDALHAPLMARLASVGGSLLPEQIVVVLRGLAWVSRGARGRQPSVDVELPGCGLSGPDRQELVTSAAADAAGPEGATAAQLRSAEASDPLADAPQPGSEPDVRRTGAHEREALDAAGSLQNGAADMQEPRSRTDLASAAGDAGAPHLGHLELQRLSVLPEPEGAASACGAQDTPRPSLAVGTRSMHTLPAGSHVGVVEACAVLPESSSSRGAGLGALAAAADCSASAPRHGRHASSVAASAEPAADETQLETNYDSAAANAAVSFDGVSGAGSEHSGGVTVGSPAAAASSTPRLSEADRNAAAGRVDSMHQAGTDSCLDAADTRDGLQPLGPAEAAALPTSLDDGRTDTAGGGCSGTLHAAKAAKLGAVHTADAAHIAAPVLDDEPPVAGTPQLPCVEGGSERAGAYDIPEETRAAVCEAVARSTFTAAQAAAVQEKLQELGWLTEGLKVRLEGVERHTAGADHRET